MTQLFNEEGQAVEALTPEEVEVKLNEAREQATADANAARDAEVEDLTKQLTDKEESLTKAQKELEGEKSKDKNLSGQREVIAAKEKVIEDLTKSVNDLKASTEQKLASLEAKDRIKMVNDLIEALSEGDKNVKEKMKFFYDNFKGDPADAKETEERVRNAYTLATGGRSARPLTSSMISSAEGIPQINPTGEKMSTELQDLAHRMGVSDQEMKKHKLI